MLHWFSLVRRDDFLFGIQSQQGDHETADTYSTNLAIKNTRKSWNSDIPHKLYCVQQSLPSSNMKQLYLFPSPGSVSLMKCLFMVMLFLLTFNKFSDILGKTPDAAGQVPRVLLDVES